MTAIAVLFTLSAIVMMPAGAAAANTTAAKAFVQWADGAGNTLNGVVQITNFSQQANQLVANGVLNGTLTDAQGVVHPITNQPISAPVQSASASCQILNLVLGPLHLNLLGLHIDLNQIVLNITAVPGHGNLLGNLLCAVANLLNGGNLSGLLTQLTGLLNQILAVLGGL
jgi:hypothetical protein